MHVGPSWPGSGQPPSVPQLYVSYRDPLGQRGVHAIGSGTPTTNQTQGATLLPGFANYQLATSNITAPLIGSFHFEPDGCVVALSLHVHIHDRRRRAAIQLLVNLIARFTTVTPPMQSHTVDR